MNKFVIILILLLLGNSLFAQQPYLNKTFLIDGSYYLPVIIIPTDTGYSCSAAPGVSIFLLDSNANLKWKKQYNIGPAYMNNLYKTQNGEYITTSTVQYGGTIEKLYLIKFNNLFDTIYTRIYITDSSTVTSPMFFYSFENSSGKYLIIGSSSKDSSGNVFSNNYSNGMILKTDTNGTLLNHKLYGPLTDSDWLNSGLQMGNNYYLFGGTYSYAPGGIVGSDRLDGWVVKTDLQGNEIASQNYGNPIILDADFTYAIPISGNRILTGKDYGFQRHSSGIRESKPWLILLNENLSIEKDFFLGEITLNGDTLSQYGLTQTIIRPDSSFTILGNYGVINTSTYEVLLKRNTIIHLNKDFKIEFCRKYKHTINECPYEYSTVISNTSDGGYVIGGYVNDNTLSPPQQAWLVKTDSLGCDGFNSCNDTALVCQILQAPDTACKNDTAWLQVKFKGRSAPYFIYANTTLALDSVYYPYTLPLWIDTLVPYIPTTLGMQQVIIKVNDPWGWHNSDTVQIFVKNCGTGSIAETWYPKKVEIYPNPATNELHVKIRTTITAPVTITIYNMQGKQVKQIITKQNENVIDISGLEQGVYGVRVVGSNVNYSDRFVKM